MLRNFKFGLLVLIFLLINEVNAGTIISWDSSQNYIWRHINLLSSNVSARLGYQLKFWGNRAYPHPSNMLSATPVYLDVYNVAQEDVVKAQIKICAGIYNAAKTPAYKVECFNSDSLILKSAEDHKWIEFNSDVFNIKLDKNLKDIYLTHLYQQAQASYYYYESYQIISIWINNIKMIEERIDMLKPIVR